MGRDNNGKCSVHQNVASYKVGPKHSVCSDSLLGGTNVTFVASFYRLCHLWFLGNLLFLFSHLLAHIPPLSFLPSYRVLDWRRPFLNFSRVVTSAHSLHNPHVSRPHMEIVRTWGNFAGTHTNVEMHSASNSEPYIISTPLKINPEWWEMINMTKFT